MTNEESEKVLKLYLTYIRESGQLWVKENSRTFEVFDSHISCVIQELQKPERMRNSGNLRLWLRSIRETGKKMGVFEDAQSSIHWVQYDLKKMFSRIIR